MRCWLTTRWSGPGQLGAKMGRGLGRAGQLETVGQLDPTNAEELAILARETGTGVLYGALRYPFD
jgi:hypothetical protein